MVGALDGDQPGVEVGGGDAVDAFEARALVGVADGGGEVTKAVDAQGVQGSFAGRAEAVQGLQVVGGCWYGGASAAS